MFTIIALIGNAACVLCLELTLCHCSSSENKLVSSFSLSGEKTGWGNSACSSASTTQKQAELN